MPRLTDTITAGLNTQLRRELSASQKYLAMAVYLQLRSLESLAGFYFRQAEEERGHAMKILNYLLDVGVPAVVPDLEAPRAEFESLQDIVRSSLEYERGVTAAINDLVDMAATEKDHATFQFLQWYVTEQVEEEATFAKLLDIIELSRGNVLQVEAYVRHMAMDTGNGGAEA